MASEQQIECDLPCIECGYILRGLPLTHRCPECGTETLVSIYGPMGALFPQFEEIRRFRRTRPFISAAKATGVSVDGVMFVHDAVLLALSLSKQVSWVHVRAADVCEAVRIHANYYFNDAKEARDLLSEWGIHSSEDVGRIVFALVSDGILRASEEDSVEQFCGLFKLTEWFQ
jgi:uncharacterized repeat protein (TIGR04138 family)